MHITVNLSIYSICIVFIFAVSVSENFKQLYKSNLTALELKVVFGEGQKRKKDSNMVHIRSSTS